MSVIVTPEGLTRELTTFPDPDNTYGEVGDGSSDNAKISKTNEGNWFKNLVLGVAQSVSYVWTFLSGISLTSGRVAFQELTSVSLYTTGWYTIAESLADAYQTISADISVIMDGSGSRRAEHSCHVSVCSEDSERSHVNSTVKSTSRAIALSGSPYVPSIRLATSNVSSAGHKIQAYCDISISVTLRIQLQNLAKNIGFTLVTPYLDDTPTLPDGVTSATFIEAGAEYKPNQGNTRLPKASFTKLTDSTVRLTFDWGEIPKQGTSLGLTYTANTFYLYDNSGNSYQFTGSETLGVISINGTEVSVVATLASAFVSLVAGGGIQATALTAIIS